MKFSKLSKNGQPVQLPNGDFLIVLESHGSDDYFSTSAWSHYARYDTTFNFSRNITIIAATTLLHGCAVVVRKKNLAIPEQYTIYDPEIGDIIVNF